MKRKLGAALAASALSLFAMGALQGASANTISVFDVLTGLPLKSGEIKSGMNVAVLVVPYQKLPVSRGVLDKSAYPELELALGIELMRYVFV